MNHALALLLLAYFSLNAVHAACVPSDHSCEFYACKEQELACGTKGYWQDFGHPYCEKFLRDESRFSQQSQIWLQDVRLCLQERVQVLSEGTSCRNLHKEAMHSHVSCYVDTGFCELSNMEQMRVYWYLKSALRSADTWKEAYLLNRACARQQHQSAVRF